MINVRKIISILLVLISLILLAVPWVYAETSFKKELISLIENIDLYVEDLDSYQSVLDDEGIDINLTKLEKNIHKITGAIDDFQVSPLEFFTISRVITANQNKLKSLVSSLGYPIGDKSNIVNILNFINKISTISSIYIVVWLITLIFGIITLLNRVFGKKNKLQICYLFMAVVLLIFFVAFASIGNNLYQESDLSEYIQFSLHLKFIAIIAVVCSVPVRSKSGTARKFDMSKVKTAFANLADKYVGSETSDGACSQSKPVFSSSKAFHFGFDNNQNEWICSQCSNRNKDEYEYCSRCGSQKPQKPKCKHCGREIEDSFIFCVYCGERIEKVSPEANDKDSGKTKFCKYCGEVIPFTSTFCPSCGEKLK